MEFAYEIRKAGRGVSRKGARTENLPFSRSRRQKKLGVSCARQISDTSMDWEARMNGGRTERGGGSGEKKKGGETADR